MGKKPTLKPGEYKWVDRGIFKRGQRKGKIVYGISYTYQGKRRLEVAGPSITIARKALAVRKAEIAQGRFNLESTKRSVVFSALIDRYLAVHSRHKRSARRDELSARHLRAFFGERRISQITPTDIEDYRGARLTAGASVASVNREHAMLKHMLGREVIAGTLGRNPAVAVPLGREIEKPFRILTREEEGLLLQHCATEFRPLLVFALNTGMRRGELVGLEWRDVDMARRQVTVRFSKSGRVRYIPLNVHAMDTLRQLPGQRLGRVFAYGDVDASKANRHLASGFRAAGIPPLRFHDLRHTFASRLVMAGVDLPTVQELLGHSTIVMTRKYSHPTPEHRREAVQRLAQSAAEVQPVSGTAPKKDRPS